MRSRSLIVLAVGGFLSFSIADQAAAAPPQSPDMHEVLQTAIRGTRTPAIAGVTLGDGTVTQEAV